MRNFFYIALAMCTTIVSAQNTITSCSATFTDMGGENSQYINSESSDWLICPDDSEKYLSLEFTYVDIEVASDQGINDTGCKDILYIYDGMNDSAPLIGNYCGQESTNGQSSSIEGNNLKVGMSFTPNNVEGCFYIKFESNDTNTRNGWQAIVECCEPTLPDYMSDGVNCPVAINEGEVFDFTVDLNCIRKGEVGNFSNYIYDENTPDCMIEAEGMPYKAYYKFEANTSGGFTSINVDPVDDLGEISFYALGPLYGTCPEYTGGFIADCITATDPTSLIFNMSPNSSYIIVVASNVKGAVRLYNDINTSSLPVELLDFSLRKKGDDVKIDWSTAHEINNQGFELYRSYDNNDFEMIAEIDAKGSYSTVSDYSFTDATLISEGDIYYFLRQRDLDGATTDYDVKSIKFDEGKSILTYPNPANNRIYIESNSTELAKVTFYNSVGRVVREVSGTLPMDISVQDIALGVYTMIVETNSNVMTTRQIIY